MGAMLWEKMTLQKYFFFAYLQEVVNDRHMDSELAAYSDFRF